VSAGEKEGGFSVMKDVKNIALPDEAPEADAMEQRLSADVDDDSGLDPGDLDALSDRDANAADVIDQAIVVPVPEDDFDPT
jgi:hypothetical protein